MNHHINRKQHRSENENLYNTIQRGERIAIERSRRVYQLTYETIARGNHLRPNHYPFASQPLPVTNSYPTL